MNDSQDISSARNAVLYGETRNSLAEWTLSPEWTEAPRVTDSRGNRLARGHKVKGITVNTISGEIQIKDVGPWAGFSCR